MASRINLIIKIDSFLKVIHPILLKHGVDVLIRKYNTEKGMFFEKYLEGNGHIGLDKEYKNVFLVSKKINLMEVKKVYDNDVSLYCIECEGGRYNDKEIEALDIRTISKTPDKTIKLLMTELTNFFKKNDEFGIGILPLDNNINKSTYYFKKDIQGKIIWRYLDKKEFYQPIKVA
jgi:hypothetical protein